MLFLFSLESLIDLYKMYEKQNQENVYRLVRRDIGSLCLRTHGLGLNDQFFFQILQTLEFSFKLLQNK